MSSQVVKFANGSTLQVRTGVLRGAGPQGPAGPPGAKGDQGPAGPVGPQGTVTDINFSLSDASTVSTDLSAWAPLALGTVNASTGLTTPRDQYTFTPLTAGNYLLVLSVNFNKPTSSSATGTRLLRIATTDGAVVVGQLQIAAVPGDDTIVTLTCIGQLDPTKLYRVEAKSRDNQAILAGQRLLSVSRVASGPPGVAGPVGPAGIQGAQGPQGPQGSAGAGYATFDALMGGSSGVDPGGTIDTTADQAVPVPATGQKPSIPYFMKTMAKYLERRIMARYATVSAANTARPTRSNGEMFTALDSGTPWFTEISGGDKMLARVVPSTSPAPTGAGQAAPGVLWVQY